MALQAAEEAAEATVLSGQIPPLGEVAVAVEPLMAPVWQVGLAVVVARRVLVREGLELQVRARQVEITTCLLAAMLVQEAAVLRRLEAAAQASIQLVWAGMAAPVLRFQRSDSALP